MISAANSFEARQGNKTLTLYPLKRPISDYKKKIFG